MQRGSSTTGAVPTAIEAAGLTRGLAQFTVGFSLAQAPARAIENAKKVILDCLGVSVLAATQEIGRVVFSFARANAAPGSCVVWGSELTTSPRDAALINGTLAHGLDYDDRNHSSTYTLAAAIAAAEHVGASGSRALEGFIVGREIRNALDPLFSHRSSGVGPGAKGWHSNGILGPIASACAASKVLELDFLEATAAIGLAAGACGALTRDGGTMAKPFRAGHAALTGLSCALLARSGCSADATALEGRFGLLEALGPLPSEVIASLGRNLGIRFQLEDDVKIKAHASCTASHSGIEAMQRLLRKHHLKPDLVETIRCDLRPYPLVRRIPERGFEGRFSLPFCLAMTLINGRVAPDDFSDENVRDPRVQSLMGRTFHDAERKQLEVILIDGAHLAESLDRPANLSAWGDIEAKFHACCAGVFDAGQASQVEKQIKEIECLSSITELTTTLGKPREREVAGTARRNGDAACTER